MNDINSSSSIPTLRVPRIHDNVRSQAPPMMRRSSKLPKSYVPGNYDVICGKGKSCFNHIGNRRFRITVELHLPKYSQSPSRVEKSSIVANIVDIVRGTGAIGFVKRDPGNGDWYDVGDHAAREKVGQTIRDILKQRDPKRRARKNQLRQQARAAAKAKQRADVWQHSEGDLEELQSSSESSFMSSSSSSSSSSYVSVPNTRQRQHHHGDNYDRSTLNLSNSVLGSFTPSKSLGETQTMADQILSLNSTEWCLFKPHELSPNLPTKVGC